jgi:hypothetical protein
MEAHKGPWQEGTTIKLDCIFGGASQVPSSDLQGESPRSSVRWLYLGMVLLKTLFLKTRPFPTMKTQDL